MPRLGLTVLVFANGVAHLLHKLFVKPTDFVVRNSRSILRLHLQPQNILVSLRLKLLCKLDHSRTHISHPLILTVLKRRRAILRRHPRRAANCRDAGFFDRSGRFEIVDPVDYWFLLFGRTLERLQRRFINLLLNQRKVLIICFVFSICCLSALTTRHLSIVQLRLAELAQIAVHRWQVRGLPCELLEKYHAAIVALLHLDAGLVLGDAPQRRYWLHFFGGKFFDLGYG